MTENVIPSPNGGWKNWVIATLGSTTFLFFSLYTASSHAEINNLQLRMDATNKIVIERGETLAQHSAQLKILEAKIDELLKDMRETRDAVIKNGR